MAEREPGGARRSPTFPGEAHPSPTSPANPIGVEPRGTPGIFVLRVACERRSKDETAFLRDVSNAGAREKTSNWCLTNANAGGYNYQATRAKDVELREDEELSDDLAKGGCAALDAQVLLFVRVSI